MSTCTIRRLGIDWTASYAWTPAEAATDDGPGCDTSVELLSIEAGSLVIPAKQMESVEVESIEEEILSRPADNDGGPMHTDGWGSGNTV